MSKKIKGALSVFFMSLIFYMMITTKYTHALGDYILEFVGLKPWTGDYSGTHLTIIYFGIIFVISMVLVDRYAVKQLNIRGRNIFIIFIILITVFYSLTGIITTSIKKNSPGLSSIGFISKGSNIDYWAKDNKMVDFTAEFELTNYSSEEKAFYISIGRELYKENDFKQINFFTLDGEKAIFKLQGNESKIFLIDLNNYIVVGGIPDGGEQGIIGEIQLSNDKGEKVSLNRSNNGLLIEPIR